jgi:hypothetical protein
MIQFINKGNSFILNDTNFKGKEKNWKKLYYNLIKNNLSSQSLQNSLRLLGRQSMSYKEEKLTI